MAASSHRAQPLPSAPDSMAVHWRASPDRGIVACATTERAARTAADTEERAMADWDPEAFENAMIADMRAHGGAVTTGPLTGHPLLILTSTGAKSGQERRAILTYSRDGDAYVVAGTAGGSPTTPAWVHNVEAGPQGTIEVANHVVKAPGSLAGGDGRRRLWEAHVEALPHFAEYPEKAHRDIPMIRLTPSAG